MSLSGCRPAVVTSLSSRNLLPALGPRLTTSRAVPEGSDSTPTSASSSPPWSSGPSMPLIEIVVVCSADPVPPTAGFASGDPQRAQNLLSSGFCWPHCVQNTLAIARCPFQSHAVKEGGCGPTVNQRFRETRNLDGGVTRVNRIAHT